jgi:ABC-type Fe3+ transport system substrate-binding protein
MENKKILVFVLTLVFSTMPAWAQQKDWGKEWTETIALARKEGKVVLRGFGSSVSQGPTAKFTERFGIPIETMTGRSSEVAARLRIERQAGIYSTDVFLGGIDTMVSLYQEKMLDTLKPVLVLPEVVDPSKWKKGKLWFMDPEERYILRVLNYVGQDLYVNSRFVKLEEFGSIKDLLDPRWKGKISSDDPTVAGSGFMSAVQLYLRFGEEFVKKLYVDQKPVFSRNKRQLTDWLARGTYPITFGASNDQVRRLQEEGFPVQPVYLPDMPGSVSAGNGLVALMSKAPHPNAAKLFVNWIASREGHEAHTRAEITAAMRNDVDESFAEPGRIPRPGVNYFDSYDWEFTMTRESWKLRIRKILESR